MRPLSTAELLTTWEYGLSQPPVWQALGLLAAANPDTPWEELARLPIGQRDAGLLHLRQWTFGPEMTALANCPKCGERVELSLAVADLLSTGDGHQTTGAGGLGPGHNNEEDEPLRLEWKGYEVVYRLPNSLDMLVLAEEVAAEAAGFRLLEQCLLAIEHEGATIGMTDLPQAVIEQIAAGMAAADPQAGIEIGLSCPNCQSTWSMGLDVIAFFWREIQAWAVRTLSEVSQLAAAYGWREADILSMSAARRQAYLQLVPGQ